MSNNKKIPSLLKIPVSRPLNNNHQNKISQSLATAQSAVTMQSNRQKLIPIATPQQVPFQKTGINITSTKASNQRVKILSNILIKEATVKEPVKCNDCSFKTADPNTLVQHKALFHHFICDVCKCVTTEQSFMDHYLKFPKQKPNRISLLKKNACTNNLSAITSTQTRPSFSCTYCKKVFATLPELRQHYQIHYGTDNIFVCPVCTRKLSTKELLKQHFYVHSKKRTALSKSMK